jgi:hypothetical protein
MKMREVLATLFTRHDAVKDQIMARVEAIDAEQKTATSRLNSTIEALLERNDTLTFRGRNNVPKQSN